MRNLKFCFNELAFLLHTTTAFTLHIALVEAQTRYGIVSDSCFNVISYELVFKLFSNAFVLCVGFIVPALP